MRISKKAQRSKLYMLRCEHKLTQEEMAARCNVSCRGYQNIEWGKRYGSEEFWTTLQREFGISDADMYPLMRVDEGEK